jgi:hypothetical protein
LAKQKLTSGGGRKIGRNKKKCENYRRIHGGEGAKAGKNKVKKR